jgi:RES domain-containing protein
MELWRICRRKFEATAFSGIGAEKVGGRWNFKGYPVVYASENLSLATLEMFVHVAPELIPDDLVAIRGTLPDSVSVEELMVDELPTNWRKYPASESLQAIGTTWLERRSSLVLYVPSAITPRERNILLNPAHPEIKLLEVEPGEAFHFDPRMFAR